MGEITGAPTAGIPAPVPATNRLRLRILASIVAIVGSWQYGMRVAHFDCDG